MQQVREAIHSAITAALPGAAIEVQGEAGHYNIVVKSTAFTGKSTLERHRLVLSAIAPLMAGDAAPVHAVDSLKTIPA